MFYLGTLPRTAAWEAASQTAPRSCFKEEREEPGYIVFVGKKKSKNMQLNIKRLLLITEKTDISS